MAKKDANLAKLEEAVRKQADSLDPAQREFVMAEFETYKWNARKIESLQRKIEEDPYDEDGLKVEAGLVRERHQLITEQTALFGHIMRWLKGTAAEASPLDEFI